MWWCRLDDEEYDSMDDFIEDDEVRHSLSLLFYSFQIFRLQRLRFCSLPLPLL
jgi:hypothetical protein